MNGNFVGRKDESERIIECYDSEKSEFVAVYGRLHVGKTYLVTKMFDENFDFRFTGLYKTPKKEQLVQFGRALSEKTGNERVKIVDWFSAFDELRKYLLSLKKEKVVVFLDELPWMDSAKSNFISAFSYFWNMWPSSETLLKLYVCGSATTWMVNKLIGDKGGLYGRVTCSIYLQPFTLCESEEFLHKVKGIEMNRHQILDLYMILGGIPYYLDMIDKDLPASKNIDKLFFKENAPLRTEYEFLFRSLFNDSASYRKVIEALALKLKGLTREEIISTTKIKDGGTLTEILRNLSLCGFVREYSAIGKKERESIFQLSDLFVLFYLHFVQKGNSQDVDFWSNISFTNEKNAWSGYAFEQVCLHHIKEIRAKLGIGGVLCNIYSWSSKPFIDSDGTKWKGGQIDLLIDRKDDVINICEIKYANDKYEIKAQYEEHLRERASLFKKVTGTKKAVIHTFITTYGVKQNMHSGIVQSEVKMGDLFKEVDA